MRFPGLLTIAMVVPLSGSQVLAQCAADAGPSRTVYAGSTTVLGGPTAGEGQPPLTYSWAPANGLSATNIPNPTLFVQSQPTTYTLTVTDDFGCTATSSVLVQVAAAPYLRVQFTNGRETSFVLNNVARLTYVDGALHVVQRNGQVNYWNLSIIDHYEYIIPNSVAPHTLEVRALLGGAYSGAVGLMTDSLRVMALIPAAEPYEGSAGVHEPSAQVSLDVLQVTGPDAIVDWVLLQLRDAIAPDRILWSRSCLIQRDGDIVATDGTSSITVPFIGHPVHVAVLHRNHLAAITAGAIELGPGQNTMDLTDPSACLPGSMDVVNGMGVMPPGDVNGDGRISYTGPSNDRDVVLSRIGGAVPTATATGYLIEDVNMDGRVRYVGAANDRDVILQTIGGSVPTVVRQQVIP